MQDVQPVAELLECPVDIRQREAAEAGEPLRVVAEELGGVLVATPREFAGGAVVAGMHAWRADRGHSHVDAGVIEERDGRLLRPRWRQHAADGMVALVGGLPKEVR